MRAGLIIFFLLLTGVAFGQIGKKRKTAKTAELESIQPTTLHPGEQRKTYAPEKSKRASGKTTYNAEKEFYDRLAELDKAHRKNERMMDNPQYSDPTYFGHKRPPKKRPPEKMKFCKVCGIRH